MNRRNFLGAVTAATAWSVAQTPCRGLLGDEVRSHERAIALHGRGAIEPAREMIFTDLRHIDAGDLRWLSPEGKAVPVAGPPEPPVPLKPDDAGIARGIRLVAQRANKEGPLEGQPGAVVTISGTIVYADGLYRAWDLRGNYPPGGNLGSYSKTPARSMTVEYAESKDGYDWRRRDLGEIPVSNVTGMDGAGFFIDPAAPPNERYKALYHAQVLANIDALWEQYQKQVLPRDRRSGLGPKNISCLFGLVSSDGLHWESIAQPLLIHCGDTDNTVYYDATLQKYVLYTRMMRADRRIIGRAESNDFRHWGPVKPIIEPSLSDPYCYDLYLNGRTAYPGLPDQHLMFPLIYRRDTQTSEIHIYTSVDGVLWDRVPDGPVLEPSVPPGWDGVFSGVSKNLVPLGQDRVAMRYWGYSHPHKYPRWPNVITRRTGWAWWPKGRLVGLVAEKEGQFHTLPISVTGRQLRINARVRSGGEIRVGVDGQDGRSAADCNPITGDSSAHPVTWRGGADLGAATGSSVRFHFQLRAAELFGLRQV